MCGITGVVNTGHREMLQRMTDSITHRGPDDGGIIWFDERRSGLGHRRLSILDPSKAGHQPMVNERGNLWITYNGEVYNFRSIRKQLESKGYRFRSHTDTEVVLKAFEEWGADSIEKFNGIFSFAIYNTDTHSLFAVRDRVGVKPFYYYHGEDCFLFASEIKSLLTSQMVPKQPDYFALSTPTRFQISPYTGFEGIYKLPPGHYLKFENGRLDIYRYWKIDPTENHDLKEDRTVDELDSLLRDSVSLQMAADVPVGLFLSGGLDSSLIAALMKEVTGDHIRSFTVRYAGNDQRFEKMADDSRYAQSIADTFGLVHNEIEISPKISELLPKMVYHLDEPLADPAAINTYLLSFAARENGIVVALNGMGGDEVFGGYRKQLACLKADIYQSIVPALLHSVIKRTVDMLPVATGAKGLRTIRWAKRFFSLASLPQIERFLASDLSLSKEQYRLLLPVAVDYMRTHYYTSQEKIFSGTNGISYLTKMCLNDTTIMLPEHNLLYADKASMAAGVESRPPLTDHRIIELMFRLPPEYRIRRNVQKYLLKRVSKRYLPKKIISRPKAPFGAPLRSWIRRDLAPMVDDFLSEETVKRRGLYDHAFIRQLILNDRKGIEDNAHIVWTLLTNEIWFRTFFD